MNGPLADYVRAVRALEPAPEEAQEIAAMLGLSFGRRAAASIAVVHPEDEHDETEVTGSIEEKEDAPAGIEYLETTAQRESPGTTGRPSWLSNAVPLPAEATRYRPPKLPFEPLLVPSRVRAMMSTLLARRVEEGALDVERLIAVIARAQPLTHLYRLESLTVRHGAQVLVDRGASMTVFRRDVQWLVAELRKVIGADRLDVLTFVDCPTRGARKRTDADWTAWHPPAHGTPVLLLTDAGIGASSADRGTHSEWERFFEVARRAGCPLFALNPYSSGRWPAELARRLRLLPWHRSLTVQLVRKAATEP